MCRHLAYIGPETNVAALLSTGTNSLLRQSWAPTDMRGGGTINADGFGVGWWSAEGVFGRYRSASPIWSDSFLREGLGSVRSRTIVAATRSATEGMPVERSAAAPFSDDRWAFSLNGVVRGWPGSLVTLAGALPVADLLRLESPTDAATLWLLLQSRLRCADPEPALISLTHDVLSLAPDSRLNMLLCNESGIWATAWYHSLWTFVDEQTAIVASEPFDDDSRWKPVPDRHLVAAMPGKLIVSPLEVGSP